MLSKIIDTFNFIISVYNKVPKTPTANASVSLAYKKSLGCASQPSQISPLLTMEKSMVGKRRKRERLVAVLFMSL